MNELLFKTYINQITAGAIKPLDDIADEIYYFHRRVDDFQKQLGDVVKAKFFKMIMEKVGNVPNKSDFEYMLSAIVRCFIISGDYTCTYKRIYWTQSNTIQPLIVSKSYDIDTVIDGLRAVCVLKDSVYTEFVRDGTEKHFVVLSDTWKNKFDELMLNEMNNLLEGKQ